MCEHGGGASRDGGEGPMCVTDRWRGRGGPHRQGLCRPTKASGRVRTAGLGSPQAHHRLDDTPEKETDAISNTRRVHRGADPGSAVWGLRPPVPCERKVFSLGRPEKMFWMCGVRCGLCLSWQAPPTVVNMNLRNTVANCWKHESQVLRSSPPTV